MFIDINTIGPEGLAFDRPLRLGGLEGPSRERIPELDVRLSGSVTPSGRRADLRARVEATVPLVCGRCLETFPWRVATAFRLAVVKEGPSGPAGPDRPGDAEDVSSLVAPDGRLQLEDVATEQLYLNLPLKPVCSPDCKGLCPHCGANRNSSGCACESDDVDPRLAPLLQFRRKSPDPDRP